jgi:hypothetical protein
MWPYKLMPDPSGAKRLASIGCDLKFAKSKIKVPVEVTNYEDFVQGTRYPKMHDKPVWFVQITIPKDLMNEIKEGSIDLADQTIELDEIEDAYEEDLDKENTQQEETGSEDVGGEMQPISGQAPVA